jgi:putative phage-type endonuclease
VSGDYKAWLLDRKQRITATDVASIMGLEGAYSTPMGVYLDKLEPVREEDDEVPEYMRWGQRLQDPILAGYTAKTGRKVSSADPFSLVTIEEYPLLGASLDAEEEEGERVPVEVKNVAFKSDDWGPEGSDQVPARFFTQAMVQMMVTRTSHAYIAALFGGRKLEVFRIDFDPEIAKGIYMAVERFWKDHILADKPPPVDGSEDWARYLGKRKHLTETIVQADSQIDALGQKLGQVREAITNLEEQEKIMRNTLLALVDQNEGIKGTGWKVTYKQTRPTTKMDYEAAFEDSMASSPNLRRQYIEKFTTEKPGSRRFLYKKETK